jgi:hypothetical protein
VKPEQHAEAAAIARCDLNTLYSVIAILEGGTISSAHKTDVDWIIKRCKSAAGKSLRRYDQHLAAIRSGQ